MKDVAGVTSHQGHRISFSQDAVGRAIANYGLFLVGATVIDPSIFGGET